ncbi:MAPEG family protein [Sphingomonas sp. MMS24-JH45]
MLGWIMATRLPAMRAAGINMGRLVGTRGGRRPLAAEEGAVEGAQLQSPDGAAYALLCDLPDNRGCRAAGRIPVALAWLYVVLRIALPLVQATVNRVRPPSCSSSRPPRWWR